MKIRLGTRGSKLALAQSMQVKEVLENAYPDLDVELCIIKTTGDRRQDVALHELNDKGVFVKEIEEALLARTIDLAVHSMKDMPSMIDERLCFTKTMLREDARDVLVLKDAASLASLPAHARIATGSARRAIQLKALRNDIEICGIRGNVETRLRKMEEEGFDGIVLAAAGLHRLQLQDRISEYLEESSMIPACGQGALAIEVRKEDTMLLTRINALCDECVEEEVRLERKVLTAIQAGCHTPFAVRAHVKGALVHLLAMYADDQKMKRVDTTFELGEEEQAIQNIVQTLLQEGSVL